MFNPKYVSEDDLMNAMDELDRNEKLFFNIQNQIIASQPAVAAMFTDEELGLLTDEEFDLLWFVVVTIYYCLDKKIKVPVITPKDLSEMEEKNWQVLEQNSGQPWRKRLDSFYINYPQEDLLSFIEDSFESDEDFEISGPVKEVLFVSAKSVLDKWCE